MAFPEGMMPSPASGDKVEKTGDIPFWKKAVMAAAVTTGGAGAVDAVGVGTERLDIRAWYEQSAAGAESRYERYKQQQIDNPDGPMRYLSPEEYLERIEFLPTPQEVEAVARLMEEYDKPVNVYSGTRLFTRLFQIVFSTQDRTGHYRPDGFFMDAHGIYLADVGSGAHRRVMTQGNLDTIVAELAHAYQNETGQLSFGRAVHEIFKVLKGGGTYDDLYDVPGTYENDAHREEGGIEQMLQNQVTLYASEANIRSRLPYFLSELGVRVGEPITQDTFSYDQYLELIRVVGERINVRRVPGAPLDRASEEMLGFLELLQGFSGESRPDDEAIPTFVLHPNETHYNAFMDVVNPPEQEQDVPITERFPMPSVNSPQDALADWREARLAATQFEERNGPMFALYLNDARILEQGQPFTREVYDRMMVRLGEAYAFIHYSPGGQTNEGAALSGLMQIVNQACFFDPRCSGQYGILELGDQGEGATMPSYAGRVVAGEPHYRALRRLFNRHRDSQEVPLVTRRP